MGAVLTAEDKNYGLGPNVVKDQSGKCLQLRPYYRVTRFPNNTAIAALSLIAPQLRPYGTKTLQCSSL